MSRFETYDSSISGWDRLIWAVLGAIFQKDVLNKPRERLEIEDERVQEKTREAKKDRGPTHEL